jgi:uncharacterized protein (TIGR02646 family)
MERIVRPKLEDIPNLSSYTATFDDYNFACDTGSRKWQSSGTIYNLLKSEVKKISESHCSFCDGYPLNDTSKETIEHYYPKAEYKHKTYEWDNLYFCCDKCQSFSNSHKPFQVTLKPDDEHYHFENHFWFDAEDGLVKLNNDDDTNARIFLDRYGINKRPEKIIARRKRYIELLKLLKDIPEDQITNERANEAQRYIFDIAIRVLSLRINF